MFGLMKIQHSCIPNLETPLTYFYLKKMENKITKEHRKMIIDQIKNLQGRKTKKLIEMYENTNEISEENFIFFAFFVGEVQFVIKKQQMMKNVLESCKTKLKKLRRMIHKS